MLEKLAVFIASKSPYEFRSHKIQSMGRSTVITRCNKNESAFYTTNELKPNSWCGGDQSWNIWEYFMNEISLCTKCVRRWTNHNTNNNNNRKTDLYTHSNKIFFSETVSIRRFVAHSVSQSLSNTQKTDKPIRQTGWYKIRIEKHLDSVQLRQKFWFFVCHVAMNAIVGDWFQIQILNDWPRCRRWAKILKENLIYSIEWNTVDNLCSRRTSRYFIS